MRAQYLDGCGPMRVLQSVLLLGGDINNPVCSSSGGRQAAGITELYSKLVGCKALVSQSCIIDEVNVG